MFRSFSQNFPLGAPRSPSNDGLLAPLSSENQNEIDGVVSRSKQLSGRQSHVSTLCDSKFLCFCLLLRQPCFYLIVNHDVVSRIRKLFSPDRKFYASWLHCKTPVTVFWSQTTDGDYSRLVTRVWPSSLSNKSAILISCLDFFPRVSFLLSF